MIGPMKKKVITSSVVTAVILILIFSVVAFVFVKQNNERIAELEKKSKVVQRYVFVEDMLVGDIITGADVMLVDVKNESAPIDSYSNLDMIGEKLKVNANAKTIVTSSLFFEPEKEPDVDTRIQEFSMITLPSDLEVDDYVDIRIRLANGEDYTVLVAEKIEAFGATGEASNTIFLKLSEEEIMRMNSAIIESYITDGIKLYAIKYIDPSTQLYKYERVDYVEKYKDAEFEIVSKVVLNDASGDATGDVSSKTIEEKKQRSIEDISVLIGLSVEETENIKIAIEENDRATLDYYSDKLLVHDTSLEETYPVKREIATLIQKNPNIVDELKAKYKVEELEAKRMEFFDTSLTEIDEFTGEIVIKDDRISKINEKLQQEITTQKTERQQYLSSLLSDM